MLKGTGCSATDTEWGVGCLGGLTVGQGQNHLQWLLFPTAAMEKERAVGARV